MLTSSKGHLQISGVSGLPAHHIIYAIWLPKGTKLWLFLQGFSLKLYWIFFVLNRYRHKHVGRALCGHGSLRFFSLQGLRNYIYPYFLFSWIEDFGLRKAHVLLNKHITINYHYYYYYNFFSRPLKDKEKKSF